MKRVVKPEGEPIKKITADKLNTGSICVARHGSILYKLACVERIWRLIGMSMSGPSFHMVGDKETVLHRFIDEGGEVYVLDSLSELADWIKDNS
jgi:hypothetical protein